MFETMLIAIAITITFSGGPLRSGSFIPFTAAAYRISRDFLVRRVGRRSYLINRNTGEILRELTSAEARRVTQLTREGERIGRDPAAAAVRSATPKAGIRNGTKWRALGLLALVLSLGLGPPLAGLSYYAFQNRFGEPFAIVTADPSAISAHEDEEIAAKVRLIQRGARTAPRLRDGRFMFQTRDGHDWEAIPSADFRSVEVRRISEGSFFRR